MQHPRLHLNLLRESERLSSSPVRIRIMLPILSLLLCVASAVWWAVLFMQLLLLNGEVRALQNELNGRKSAHSAILAEMAKVRDLTAELDQLTAYGKGRRTYGHLLAQLADVMPTRVQLTSLVIPEPPPQNLANPKNKKLPPLLGPQETTETVSLRMTGRTVKAQPVTTLMETLEGESFRSSLNIRKTGAPDQQSPRIHSFRQENAGTGKNRQLLAFDVEYRCPERRFEK